MEEESIDSVLRPGNLAMLYYLLEDHDKDIFHIFNVFQDNESSEYLISSLEEKTDNFL